MHSRKINGDRHECTHLTQAKVAATMPKNPPGFHIFRVNGSIACQPPITMLRPYEDPRPLEQPSSFSCPSFYSPLLMLAPRPFRPQSYTTYAFFLLPLAPSAGAPPTALPLALTASSTVSLSAAASASTPPARPGSAFPIAGAAPASICWKGGATKWPALSNQSAKGRERVVVVAVGAVGDCEVMVRL